MSSHQHQLQQYAECLARLAPDNLAELAAFCDDGVLFKDPFNEHRGKQAFLDVLEDMFTRLDDVSFQVNMVDVTSQGGYLRWDFSASSSATGLINVAGVSQISINEAGLITEHIDYWDGSEVMTGIPVLGALIRWIKRRAAYTE